MKLVTLGRLKKLGACEEGKNWFSRRHPIGVVFAKKLLNELIEAGRIGWCLWLLPRLMTHKQAVMYACFSARNVLETFEVRYPSDNRPRMAIEAAERWAKNPTKANKDAAYAAANAGAYAADAAADAANAAYGANAAYAAYAAYAADAATDAAANAGAYAADARRKAEQAQIGEGCRILGIKGVKA